MELQNAGTITISPIFTKLLSFLFFAVKACSENISESIDVNLMKLHTLIDSHQRTCRVQEP